MGESLDREDLRFSYYSLSDHLWLVCSLDNQFSICGEYNTLFLPPPVPPHEFVPAGTWLGMTASAPYWAAAQHSTSTALGVVTGPGKDWLHTHAHTRSVHSPNGAGYEYNL